MDCRVILIPLVFAFVGLRSAPAGAQGTNPPPLALDGLVARALADNATLRSMRAKWEAMSERTAQAGALSNPMFRYSGMDMARGGAWPDTNEKRFMVEQEFPWFGKRDLRAGIAGKEAEAMQRELEAMTREVVMTVKETYFDLYAVQRVIAIARQEEAVIRRMEKVAESLYAAGDRSQSDVIKAQAEITMLKQKLLEMQTQEATLKARLNTYHDRRADSPLGAAVTPPEAGFDGNVDTLMALAAANRPEVQAAQARIERYRLEEALMAKESLPDYRLGLEYRDVGGGDNMAMFTVSVDIPVWRSRYRAGVREAEKMRASSQAARDAAERQSAFDVQDAHFKLMTARRTLDLYRTELVPQAEARFSASEAGYRAGKVDFMDLLESERFLLNVRMMVAMTEGAVGMQVARLERAVGSEFKSGTPDATPAGEKGPEHGH